MKKQNPANLNTTRPLQLYPTGYSNSKVNAYLLSDFDVWELGRNHKRLECIPEIICSIEAVPKVFTKEDSISLAKGGGCIYHKRMVDKMLEVCPDDFQALPVKLINSANSKEQFENHDYYLLNILHVIDALDEERSVIEYWNFKDGTPTHTIKQKRFYDDRWDGHLIAEDRRSYRLLWHPRLAREFVKHKSIMFLADDEI